MHSGFTERLLCQLFFLFLFVSVFLPVKVFSEEIRAGIISFSPYYNVEEEEIKGGIYTEILKRILERAGIEYSLGVFSPRELFSGIESGDIHLWMGTPANEALVSSEKITEANIRVYTHSSKTPPSSLEELRGKRIVVIDGYNYGGLLKYLSDPSKGIILDRVKSHDTAFSRLSSGLERYVIDYQEPADMAISATGAKNIRSNILKTVETHIYVSKKAPGAGVLMEKLVKAYEALKVEGYF